MNAGRKRSFDKEEALDKAMRVFWNNGYTGTSLTDLTSALGINKPSLYAAFGNKEQLFGASLKHYMAQYGMPKVQQLNDSQDKPLMERLRVYLYGLIDLFTGHDTPKGCFVVKSRCEAGSVAFPSEVVSFLDETGVSTEKFLEDFLGTERKRGSFPENISLKDASGYLLSIMYGLAVQARGGKSKEALRSAADFAVRTFPCKN